MNTLPLLKEKQGSHPFSQVFVTHSDDDSRDEGEGEVLGAL